MTCQVIRQSDEMVCAKCRLRWDVSDPEPPLCGLQVATRAHDEDVERANHYVSALAPQNPLLARPVANPDYEQMRKKISARFSKTLAYLAK